MNVILFMSGSFTISPVECTRSVHDLITSPNQASFKVGSTCEPYGITINKKNMFITSNAFVKVSNEFSTYTLLTEVYHTERKQCDINVRYIKVFYNYHCSINMVSTRVIQPRVLPITHQYSTNLSLM